MQQGGGGELAGIAVLPFRHRKAHRFHRALALAVLGEAIHVQDLVEGNRRPQAQQGGAALGPPGALGMDLPFHHRLAVQQLDLPHRGAAGDVQDGRRGLVKGQGAVGGDQLVKDGGPFHPPEGGLALLDAAVGQGGDGLGAALGAHRRHQPIGPPHLDPPGVHRPAVDVLGLPFHRCAPGGKGKFRQVQRLVEGDLLLGLAQPRPILPLIVDGTADVPFQRQLARLQLLLQHHRAGKTLDDLEHLGQIVRDEDLGLHRDFCLDGAAPAAGVENITENFQFHGYGAPFLSFCQRMVHSMRCQNRLERTEKARRGHTPPAGSEALGRLSGRPPS